MGSTPLPCSQLHTMVHPVPDQEDSLIRKWIQLKKLVYIGEREGAGITFRGRTCLRSCCCGGISPNLPAVKGAEERQSGLRKGEGIW